MQIQKLKEIIEGEIVDGEEDLKKYSHDASIFEMKPESVIFPKNSEDVKKLVLYVSREKEKNPGLSLTPRSAGTDMSGGSITNSLLLDFTKYFNKILEMGQDYGVVQPGVYYRDFEKQTLLHNLIMPAYPASRAICAVGGMVGNNAGGEKSFVYGQVKDYVEEITAVLSDGNEYTFGPLTESQVEDKIKRPTFEGQIYREMFGLIKNNYEAIKKAKPTTSKNSSGYLLWDIWDKKTFNLAKVFAGSQGTLGIITKIKFKLVQPKPKSELLVMFLKDLRSLGDIIKEVKDHKPESFEMFDDHTLKLALKLLPDLVKKMKGNTIKLMLKFLPELWMSVTGGIPKLILLAEFTGENEQEVAINLRTAQADVEKKFGIKTHITKSLEETQKYWVVRRESFNMLRSHSIGKITAPFIDDIIVHPDQLPEFLPKLNEIFKKYPSLIYTIAGHAGDANFHIIPLMDLSKQSEREIIPKLSEEVFTLVLEYQGSMSAEHNDGMVRGPYLEQMYGWEVLEIFKKTKNIFDPKNIFNPHKKTDATLEYSFEHIRHA
jgi:FAD/FMN-containing dehydrogenase